MRSNGTVTYVGKDIAYQLWKFGLLGRDFHYRHFHKTIRMAHRLDKHRRSRGNRAPAFGHADRVYNVIDARQSYLQNVVVAGLRALGLRRAGGTLDAFQLRDRRAHAALRARTWATSFPRKTPRGATWKSAAAAASASKPTTCSTNLKPPLAPKWISATPEVPDAERAAIAHSIADRRAAIFHASFARNTIIAFDFEDALSFEGETGPYCQYAVVRIRGIWRKERRVARQRWF